MNDDSISRKQAIELVQNRHFTLSKEKVLLINDLEKLPPTQPEIIYCEDCRYGMRDPSFPHQYFCKFKGDEWNNGDYFCGHAKKREEAE